MKKIYVDTNATAIADATLQVKEQLMNWKVKKENLAESLFLVEQLLTFLSQTTDSKHIQLGLSKSFWGIKIHITCKGRQLEISDALMGADSHILEEKYGSEIEGSIRSFFLDALNERFKAKYSHGVNNILINVQDSPNSAFYNSVLALLLAIVFGLLIRFACPSAVSSWLADNILSSIYTIFLHAVQIIIAPLVFFSLAACMCRMSDLTSLGRAGIKIICCYLLTTCFACLMTFGIHQLLQPGIEGLPAAVSGSVDHIDMKVSLKDTLINIVPNNFLGAFVNADMLQVIFLGFLAGIAAGRLGAYSEKISSMIDAFNSWFGLITSYIIKCLPLALFGAVSSMVITIDVSAVAILAKWVATVILGMFGMLLVYLILIWTFGKLNPMCFVRKFGRAAFTAFTTASSGVTMPVTMNCCSKLGISKSLYCFSIPLGVTINMDGYVVLFTSTTLFFANLYGIHMDADMIMTAVLTIILLSIAAPGVPGSFLACLIILVDQIGLPADCLALVIGILPILDNFDTLVNVTGDGAVTTIVANNENLLDKEMYNSAE